MLVSLGIAGHTPSVFGARRAQYILICKHRHLAARAGTCFTEGLSGVGGSAAAVGRGKFELPREIPKMFGIRQEKGTGKNDLEVLG